MKFGNRDNIIEVIRKFSEGKYEIVTCILKTDEILNDMSNMEIIQMRRKNYEGKTKTLFVADISKDMPEERLSIRLKDVMTLAAIIKESLHSTENVDLYLFLALPKWAGKDECIRIESTEQLCRKYVLMPDEDINDFLERTFLSKMIMEDENLEGDEPIAQALMKTSEMYSWLTEDMQKKWKKFFMEYSGIDLAEKLVGEIEQGQLTTKESEN